MKALRTWPVLLALAVAAGLTIWVFSHLDLGVMAQAVARVGAGGFALLWLGLIGVLALLGAALLFAMPGEPLRRLPLFLWSRMVREAASDLLPFSQVGGLVVGARALLQGGLVPTRIYAAMIVDLTTEMISQMLFTLFGLWMLGVTLLDPATTRDLRPIMWAGSLLALGGTIAFMVLQRPALRLMALLARRVLPDVGAGVEQVIDELAGFYRRRASVAAALAFNLLAWLASTANAWLILWLMDEPLPFAQIAALESLIFLVRSAAFLIPGALGVQEAAYVLLAPAFGLDPSVAVTLSIVKRGRELAVAVPALVLWQWSEIRLRMARGKS